MANRFFVSAFTLAGCALSLASVQAANASSSVLFPSAPEQSSNWLTQPEPIEKAVGKLVIDDLKARAQCVESNYASFCIAPGTTKGELAEILERLPERNGALGFSASARWNRTARTASAQNAPLVITYSFVPDGVSIAGGGTEQTSPNVLHATFNAQFGGEAVWKAKFRQCFDQWSKLTGIQYVEETNDDGARLPDPYRGFAGSSGVSGVRGDIRIAAHPIDGQWGVLAYNYFPEVGDVVFDSNENWANSSYDYRFFRNTFTHEHGHGLGLDHVWPLDHTKLMEPYLNTNFDGPQDDDIRGAQLQYGDDLESNDTANTATDLGALSAPPQTLSSLSTHKASDVDWFKFTVPANASVSVNLTPVGKAYQVASSDNSATLNSVDTKSVNDLQFEVFAPDKTTLLSRQNATSRGGQETLQNYLLSFGAGTYYLKVSNVADAFDSVQGYSVTFSAVQTAPATVTFNASVKLQNYVGASKPLNQLPFTVSVDGASAIVSASGSSSAATLSLTIPATGAHILKVKAPGFLARSVSVNGASPALNVTLLAGDINDDNRVDDFDLFALTSAFLTSDSASDLNGDGTVDDFDLFALTSNFLTQGE